MAEPHRRTPDAAGLRRGDRAVVQDSPVSLTPAADTPAADVPPSRMRVLGPVALSVRGALLLAAVLAVAGAIVTVVVGTDVDAANVRELAWSTRLVGVGETWPVLHHLASAVSWLGDEQRTVPLVAFAATALLLARRPLWAAYLVVVSLGGVVVTSAIKTTIGRPRPPLVDQPVGEELLSFPSGHTFAGITVWLSVALIALAVLPPRWRGGIAVVAMTIAVLQGPSRLVVGRHWPTDVLGAWLLASSWLLLCLVATTLVASALARRATTSTAMP